MIATEASWWEAAADYPVETAVGFAALTAAAVGAGLVLRALSRRSQSLRHGVLAIVMTSLAIGAMAALVLARAMVLNADEARTTVGVLAVTALFAIVLAAVASSPLGRDAARIERAVRRLEHDDRSTPTGVRRADELGQAARALDELTQRLDALQRERAALEQERRLMIASIGHDLRTPLAALRVSVEALVDGVASDPPRYLKSMSQNVDVLAALIDDLFLLSRIDAGRFELDRSAVDLVEIVTEAVEMLRPTALSRNVSLGTCAPTEVKVEVSPSAIGRVIRNLVDNAIRHTPNGSSVDVTVTVVGSSARVEVADQGEGFPPEFASQAFDRFSRADPSRMRSTGGAGLGLAIARGLVEAHGGTIEIRPAPGGRVSFVIPLATC